VLSWDTPEDLVQLLRDWTRPERDGDRRRIREAAAALAVERFGYNRFVEELLAIVRDMRRQRGLV
jgi:glycosyltransferase involved in cell wall biosynthesis